MTLANRDTIAEQFMTNNIGQEFKFTGTHFDMFLNRPNANEVTVHKKWVFRVHNEIGGRTSWFKNIKIPIKPKVLRFENDVNKPENWNPCIAVAYVPVKEGAAVNPTRLTYSLYTKYYWDK